MKKILAVFIIVLFVSTIQGQEKDNEYRTIFGSNKIHTSGFGGFNMEFSSIGGKFAFGAGGSGGVLLNDQVFFGGFGMGYTLDKSVDIGNFVYDNSSMGYGGLMFGYIFNGKAAIHPAIFLQTGWGAANFYQPFNSYNDNIFVLNPSIELEMNITRFFRVSVGGHYQFTMGINEYDSLSNSDFSGPGGSISFKFGWF